MKIVIERKDKIIIGSILIAFFICWIFAVRNLPPTDEAFSALGHRWVVTIGKVAINPATVIMGTVVFLIVVWFAASVRKELKLIPGRKQALAEWLLESFYQMVEDTVPDKRFVKPTFVVATSLFLYIWVSNMLGSVPGISFVGFEDGTLKEISLFTDTWQPPTADLNTNLTYALLVFVISHAFAIKAKGFKAWLKSWFEPNPIMFPMNLIGELAKPLSHSLRLFGNIAGGGILVFIFSYLVKYFLVPVFLWGFFGIFVGTIQALVFAILAIAYISAQLT